MLASVKMIGIYSERLDNVDGDECDNEFPQVAPPFGERSIGSRRILQERQRSAQTQ